jgi:hypothetical protein
MVSVAYNQPDPAYRREIGENQSSLKNILVSPAHYQVSKKRRFVTTINMEIGSAVHCKALEGDEEFERRYVLKPDDISLTTKEGKEWKAAQVGKTVLTNSDKDRPWDSVVGMTDSLRSMEWFNPSQSDYRKFNELSIYWDAMGIPCKGRLDRLVDNGDEVLVLDLKTTDSVDKSVFEKKVCGGMNYIFQAAWYAEAARLAYNKPAKFIFIGIERAAPWTADIFEVSDEMMTEGIKQINEARRILGECLRTKSWPKPNPSYNVMNLPPWYRSPVKTAMPGFEELF